MRIFSVFTDRDPKGEVGDGWMGSVREWESERGLSVVKRTGGRMKERTTCGSGKGQRGNGRERGQYVPVVARERGRIRERTTCASGRER